MDDIDEESPKSTTFDQIYNTKSGSFDHDLGRIAPDTRPPVYRDQDSGIQLSDRAGKNGDNKPVTAGAATGVAVESLLDLQEDTESTSYNNLPSAGSTTQENLHV